MNDAKPLLTGSLRIGRREGTQVETSFATGAVDGSIPSFATSLRPCFRGSGS